MKHLMEESDSPFSWRRALSEAVRASVSDSDSTTSSRSTSSSSERSGWNIDRACPSCISPEATNSYGGRSDQSKQRGQKCKEQEVGESSIPQAEDGGGYTP